MSEIVPFEHVPVGPVEVTIQSLKRALRDMTARAEAAERRAKTAERRLSIIREKLAEP